MIAAACLRRTACLRRAACLRRVWHRLGRSRRGATALEFAIVAIPLVMLIFGVVEFGRLLFADQALEQAAAETARCMGVKSTLCTSNGSYSQTATASYLQSWLSDANITVTSPSFNANTSCSGIAGFSTVSLSYSFQTALPGIIAALAPGLTLSAFACFPNQS